MDSAVSVGGEEGIQIRWGSFATSHKATYIALFYAVFGTILL